jgi:sugar/nucleoside kinase (ribokinase family)
MSLRSTDRHKVLCLGRTYCDILFTGLRDMPALGRERFAESVAIAAGGGAYITAAHLAALGRPAALLTRLGTDGLSQSLDRELEASNVDLSFVERSDDAGPQPTVALIKDGERAFVSRRAGSSRPATLERALSSSGATHLHIAEFATLKDSPDLILMARDHGLTVSLDPSWDDDLIRQDKSFFRACQGIDVFLPNMEEGAALTGEETAEKIMQRLKDDFPLVILKLGAQGAAAADDSRSFSVGAPSVAVVDTTGACDAFNAGFLHSWLETGALEQSVSAGIELGALSIQFHGGAPRI